jgi:hypothetical protein
MMSFCISADTRRPCGTNRIVAWSGIPQHAQYQMAMPNRSGRQKPNALKKDNYQMVNLKRSSRIIVTAHDDLLI